MQAADGLAQIVGTVLQVRRLGREERQRVVAPVVAQPAFEQEAVLQERMHRQQFHRRDSQALQVLDEARVGQRRAGAAQRLAQVFALHRNAAQVDFVDHAVTPVGGGPLAAAPVERQVVHHHRLGHGGRAVAAVHRQVGAGVVQAIAEQRVAPVDRAGQLARVRVEQQFVRVEAMAVARIVGTMGPQAVDQAGLRVGQVGRARSRRCIRAGRSGKTQFLAAAGVEQADFDAGGVGREHREVHAQAVADGAQWIGLAGGHAGQEGGIHGQSP